ncbi:PilZ domain-containing protein [Sphingomonas tabacisoli]|uniref:PilZ domain-containing protein n=1 Tax=Sphingomonas tabacisoli TaxID=2249466 RepID=A0ABW4I444_9SPHN
MLKRLKSFLADTEPDDVENSDKRQHKRHSVLLQATLYPIDAYCEAVVHDLSETGLMGEAEITLTVGQVVHLTVEKATLTGAVRWTRGQRFGLALIGSNEIWTTLSEMEHGHKEGHQPRNRRVRLDTPAQLRTGRPPRPVTVRNLSQRGMLVDSAGALEPGQHVLVHINKRELIAGTVQWCNGAGRLGVRSDEPIGILSIVYSEA